MGFNQETVAGACRFPLPAVTLHSLCRSHSPIQFHMQVLPPPPPHTHTRTLLVHSHIQKLMSTLAATSTLTHTGGGQRRMEGVMEERMKKGSAGLLGSQLLLGCCLLLAMSCNCQFILSQAFHHHMQPGWRKPPESLRNLLATSHQQRLQRCAGARDVHRILLHKSVSL